MSRESGIIQAANLKLISNNNNTKQKENKKGLRKE
jgi:hypothetical protein